MQREAAAKAEWVRVQREAAGPNPMVNDAKVREECVTYLASRIMQAAEVGWEGVTVMFLDIPAVRLRHEQVAGYEYIRDTDLAMSVAAVIAQFEENHPDFQGHMRPQLQNSLRFEW